VGHYFKNRTTELVKLDFYARHRGVSTITQQLTSITKPYRENSSKLVVFHNTNRHDMKTVINCYLHGVDHKELKNIMYMLKIHLYARLEVSLRYPYGYRKVITRIKNNNICNKI
jgi:hypothetical protein